MPTVSDPAWSGLFRELLKQKGTDMIIGANDAGKSTLARYLAKQFVFRNIPVSLVDADVGQSALGLPGTVSMAAFKNEKEIEKYAFERMVFVGSVNPATRMRLIIEASERMTKIGRERSDIVLIDTSGLVSGDIGRSFKIRKIRKIAPDHVIALQRDEELEHILRLLTDIRIHRIKVSPKAIARNQPARARYREKKLRDYFSIPDVKDFLVRKDEVRLRYNGKPCDLNDLTVSEGAIIGLNHDADTKAMGVVREISGGAITFASRLRSLRNINTMVFGDMKLSLAIAIRSSGTDIPMAVSAQRQRLF
jgi:polynucleotide 5'-hydroxyl-kinase GRC3/NOL9